MSVTGDTKREIAYRHIKKMILDRRIDCSRVLSEIELARALNMSRTPVREATQKLQSEGFVQVYPHKGIVIRNFTLTDANEFFDFRMALEEFAIRNVVKKLSRQNLDVLQDIIKKQENYVIKCDLKKYLKYDVVFHNYIAEILGNTLIITTLNNIRERFISVGISILKTKEALNESLEGHKNIYSALESGNVDSAVDYMHRHMLFGKAMLLE